MTKMLLLCAHYILICIVLVPVYKHDPLPTLQTSHKVKMLHTSLCRYIYNHDCISLQLSFESLINQNITVVWFGRKIWTSVAFGMEFAMRKVLNFFQVIQPQLWAGIKWLENGHWCRTSFSPSWVASIRCFISTPLVLTCFIRTAIHSICCLACFSICSLCSIFIISIKLVISAMITVSLFSNLVDSRSIDIQVTGSYLRRHFILLYLLLNTHRIKNVSRVQEHMCTQSTRMYTE